MEFYKPNTTDLEMLESVLRIRPGIDARTKDLMPLFDPKVPFENKPFKDSGQAVRRIFPMAK